jgi:tetratricopeptide (TPR) repeat protein
VENRGKIIRPAKTEEATSSQKLSDIIVKYRIAFLSGAGAIILVLLVIGLYSIFYNSRSDASARAMEEVKTQITSWSSEKDATKKAALLTTITSDLTSVTKKWPGSFAAQEAFFTEASLAAQQKDWVSAEKYSMSASKVLPKSYLAPIALEAAAVAAEEQNLPDKSFGYYTTIIKDYSIDNPGIAHAYFSLGRLNEGKSDWKSAMDNYQKVLSSYPSSDWAKLAKDRVIYLKSLGH